MMPNEPQDNPRPDKLQPEYTLPTGDRLKKMALIGVAYSDAMNGGKDRDIIMAAAKKLDDQRSDKTMELGAAGAVQRAVALAEDIAARAQDRR